MNIEKNENTEIIRSHSFEGLTAKNLVHPNSGELRSDGIWVIPTKLGAQLFLWANAYPNEPEDRFIDRALEIPPLEAVNIPLVLLLPVASKKFDFGLVSLHLGHFL